MFKESPVVKSRGYFYPIYLSAEKCERLLTLEGKLKFLLTPIYCYNTFATSIQEEDLIVVIVISASAFREKLIVPRNYCQKRVELK